MTKYRLLLALVAGASFSALAVLLLNLKFTAASVVLSFLLMPGWLIASFPLRSNELYSPLAVLAANGALCAALAYFPVARQLSRLNASSARRRLILSALPALAFVSLACMPSLNPMWPQWDEATRG